MACAASEPSNQTLFSGAGGVRLSAVDMLIFAKAVLDPNSPIAAAVETSLPARLPRGSSVDQAFGWEVTHHSLFRELLLHEGQTHGYRATLALKPAKGRATVVLINSAAEPSAIDLGLHLALGTGVWPVAPYPRAPPRR